MSQHQTSYSAHLPRSVPFQAMALPKYYVDRPEIRQVIKAKLIDRSPTRSKILVLGAVDGLGGVGKSVIAAAIANDPDVQSVCKDGVLWVTLGSNPDILPCLYDWIRALGDQDFHPTTIDAASAHLRSLLRYKKMLLVVDDVWQTEHVQPFQVRGASCRVLVTTREADVPGADRTEIDVMSEAEAWELLLSKVQVKLLTPEAEQPARKLMGLLAGLPLAVDLAGAQIVAGVSWNKLLIDLQAEIAYLASPDQEIALQKNGLESSLASRSQAGEEKDEKARKRLWLKASLNLSLKILTVEQLQQFAWLGVLPANAVIQPQMAATLWSVPLKQATAILSTLRAKALLLDGGEQGDNFSYRIHDLIHNLARELLTGKGEKDIPGLDLQWQNAHSVLLDRYYQQTKDNLWHTLPDDGYIFSALTWHMEQAGRLSELHGLLREVTDKGRNGWYEACDFSGQNARFVTDIGRAWKLAEEMYVNDFSHSNSSHSLGLQIRYALISSTLNIFWNSMSIHVPAELMVALVKNKKRSIFQGLAYAKQKDQHLPSYGSVANYALNAQESRKRVIVQELAPDLPENLLAEALDIARSICLESDRIATLDKLSAYLPEDLLAELPNIICRVQDEYSQSVDLPEKALLDKLNIVRNIRYEPKRVATLSKLVFLLPANLLPEVLDVVHGFQHESSRTLILNQLAPLLPEKLLLEALNIVRGFRYEAYRNSLLSNLAPYLPANLFREALDIVHGVQSEPDRAAALSQLAAYLPANLFQEALDIARGFQSDSDRATVLCQLAPHLPAIVSEALDVIRHIQDEYKRALALANLAPYLPANLFREALDIANNFQSASDQAGVLSQLAPRLPEKLLSEVLNIVRDIQYEFCRINLLIELFPHLPVNLLSEALDVIRGFPSGSSQAFIRLVPYLPVNLLAEALDVARNFQNEYDRASALIGLCPHLPKTKSEALQVIRSIRSDSDRVDALRALAPHLPANMLLEALNATCGIQDHYSQAIALSGLAAHLPEIVPEILDVICCIRSDYFQSTALIMLTPHLSANMLLAALAIAHNIPNAVCRNDALSELNSPLPRVVQKSLDFGRDIWNNGFQSRILRDIASRMDRKLCQFPAWSERLHTLSHQDRNKLLEEIPKLLPVIIHLSNRSTLKLVVEAIREVCQQWP